eukprot:9212955-Lingulodinium_polyedra.AAC.1
MLFRAASQCLAVDNPQGIPKYGIDMYHASVDSCVCGARDLHRLFAYKTGFGVPLLRTGVAAPPVPGD